MNIGEQVSLALTNGDVEIGNCDAGLCHRDSEEGERREYTRGKEGGGRERESE